MMTCRQTRQTRTLPGHVRHVWLGNGGPIPGQTRTHPLGGVRLSGPAMPPIRDYLLLLMNDPRDGEAAIKGVPLGNGQCGGRGAATFHPLRKISNQKNPCGEYP